MLLAEPLRLLGANLSDPLHEAWHRDDCVRYLNSGIQMVATYRPDCATETGLVQLVEGCLQSLPPEAGRLLDALTYCDTDGAPRSALRRIERSALDACAPDWMAHPAVEQVEELMYDERLPAEFLVYPPSVGAGFVQLRYSVLPAQLDPFGDIDQTFPLPEKYLPAVVAWATYQALARDGEHSPNFSRAGGFQQSFYSILNIKTKVDASYAYAPRAAAQGGG